MILLEKSPYLQVEHLLNEANIHYPLLLSILDGDVAGRVLVDQEMPTAALVVSDYRWVYYLGNESNLSFVTEAVDFLKEDDGPLIWFGISQVLKQACHSFRAVVFLGYPRIRYLFNESAFTLPEPSVFMDAEAQISPINCANIDAAMEFSPSFHQFWNGPERFLERGFGFVMMRQRMIVSQVIAASVARGEVEVNIETIESCRGNGYASRLCYTFVQTCLDKGLLPKWDCMTENEPSKALARRLGFEELETYPVAVMQF